AIEVQDRQHRAVRLRIEELVRMPAGGERPSLRFPIADDAEDLQARVIEGGAVRVRERIAELTAFMDRARRLGRVMARNACWKGKLPKELLQSDQVRRDVGIRLR